MGFKLARSNGSLVIDSNYLNLGLRQKGVISMTNIPNPSLPTLRTAEITVSATQSFIAFRCTALCALMYAVPVAGGMRYGFNVNSSEVVDLEWWLFDHADFALKYATAGKLIVRRPSDQKVVFDSRNKYLKTQDFFLGRGSRSYPRSPAVILSNRFWAHSAQGINAGSATLITRRSSAVRVNSNTVTVDEMFTYYEISPNASLPKYSWQGGQEASLIIDVANY